MACYLSVDLEETEHECEGCTRPVSGLVAWTDELHPRKLMPVCVTCLDGLDADLAELHPLAEMAYAVIRARREGDT